VPSPLFSGRTKGCLPGPKASLAMAALVRTDAVMQSALPRESSAGTGDDNPLDGRANDLAYRKEQLRRLQDEVIELEDLKAGVGA